MYYMLGSGAGSTTARATGYKTHNGVISQSADAVKGQKETPSDREGAKRAQ
jgi:hypothetical protein